MGRRTARGHAQGECSRRRILEATLEIAARRGYDGTTVARVTEATGLPASSIYWHFGSKDELLADVLEHSFREWRPAVASWTEAPDDGDRVEQLEKRVRGAITSTTRQPEFWRLGVMLGLEKRPREPAARRRFLEVRVEVQQHIADWWRLAPGAQRLGDDLDLQCLLAQLTLAWLDGLFVAAQTDPGLGVAADRLARIVARGLDVMADEVPVLARSRAVRAAPAPRPEPGPPPASGRDRILLAAAEVAAERGYQGTSISRICARAGLPASSLYWAYKDKDDLLAAVVRHSYDEWRAGQPALEPITAGAPWADALRSWLTSSFVGLEESPNFLRIGHMLGLNQTDASPAGRDLFLAVRQHARDMIAEWFTDVLHPDLVRRDPDLAPLLSRLIMAFGDGLFLGLQLDTPRWDPPLAAEVLVLMLEAAVAVATERLAA